MTLKMTSFAPEDGAPTPPHPTPATDTHSDVGDTFATDLSAVDKSLAPIQEDLNEAAEEAMIPSPPINTPAFSPAPSIVIRQVQRNRGMSGVHERLANLSTAEVVSSTRSEAGTMDGEGQDSGVAVPSAAGPSEYIQRYTAQHESSVGAGSSTNNIEAVKDGVLEKSVWADEVIYEVERGLMRLEQLAQDDFKADKSKTIEDCYKERLEKVLASTDRMYPVSLKKD